MPTTLSGLRRDINNAKKSLMNRKVCENFGQNVVQRLEDKHIDLSSYTHEMNQKRNLLNQFSDWCATYDGK